LEYLQRLRLAILNLLIVSIYLFGFKVVIFMKAKKKFLMAIAGAIFTLLGTMSTAPAQASVFNFEFKFNAQETGENVNGNFVFDDSIKPGVTPDGATFYGNASSKYTINVGKDVFTGSSNSIVVARDFFRPDNSGLRADVIGFDNFQNFNPSNPQFLATFAYPPSSLRSDALSDIAVSLPSSALALINTPTGATLSSLNAFTKITPVPEPASMVGILTLSVGTISLLKRKRQYN